jgi:hypothetical protein
MTTGRPIHRFSTKRFIAPLGVMATVVACLAITAPTQAADGSCVPAEATDDAFGAWEWSRFTEWRSDPTTPADPDGAAGERDRANVIQVGEQYAELVPGSAEIQHSGWVTAMPAGDGWSKFDYRTVTDKAATTEQVLVAPAVPAVAGSWQEFSPNKDLGTFEGPPTHPTDPRGTWSGSKTDGGPQQDASGVFLNGTGNGSWFYRSQGTPAVPAVYRTVEHPAETHEEIMFIRTVATPGHTEYHWSVYERTVTPGEPSVVCPPVDPIDPVDPVDPVGSGTVVEPGSVVEPGPVGDPGDPGRVPAESDEPQTLEDVDEPTQQGRPADRPAALPLSIDAGL